MGTIPMDLRGKRFGRWLVLDEPAFHKPQNNHRYYKCQCDCGKIQEVTVNTLNSGRSNGCAQCAGRAKLKHNLRGKVFGQLTVLDEPHIQTGGIVKWKCRCSCGAVMLAWQHTLIKEVHGTTRCKACQKERAKLMASKASRAKTKDLRGRVFDSWTVLDRPCEYGEDQHALWWCKCACGTEALVRAFGLLSGKSQRCVSCAKTLMFGGKIKEGLYGDDIRGKAFNRWTVLSDEPNRSQDGLAWLWHCRCACGTLAWYRKHTLESGKTPGCRSCMRTFYDGRAAKTSRWFSCKWGAQSRGHEVTITKERFLELVSMPCHYCGVPPLVVNKANLCGRRVTKAPVFISNGLDRVDNAKGYTEGNVVSCCFPCNRAKGTMSAAEFEVHLDRLVCYRVAVKGLPSKQVQADSDSPTDQLIRYSKGNIAVPYTLQLTDNVQGHNKAVAAKEADHERARQTGSQYAQGYDA